MGAAAAERRRARRRARELCARPCRSLCACSAILAVGGGRGAPAPTADPRPPSLPSRTVSYHTPYMRALQV